MRQDYAGPSQQQDAAPTLELACATTRGVRRGPAPTAGHRPRARAGQGVRRRDAVASTRPADAVYGQIPPPPYPPTTTAAAVLGASRVCSSGATPPPPPPDCQCHECYGDRSRGEAALSSSHLTI
jgi:hypothetical protein